MTIKQFDVWAPRASAVTLRLREVGAAEEEVDLAAAAAAAGADPATSDVDAAGESSGGDVGGLRSVAMVARGGGWWTAPSLTGFIEADYGYVLAPESGTAVDDDGDSFADGGADGPPLAGDRLGPDAELQQPWSGADAGDEAGAGDDAGDDAGASAGDGAAASDDAADAADATADSGDDSSGASDGPIYTAVAPEVTDEQVLPDPRSRRQPSGVHGLSRTYDPSTYTWNDETWKGRQLAGGVVYELHLGTFTPEGTLDAAIDKLDHLVSIGVDFVELLPVNAFNGTHNWGYDGVLWFAVHELYGGPEGYQRFVDACHAKGLAVIQDVVYNHLGPSGNYLPLYGPYLNDAAANTWGSAINLDGPDSAEVRRYIIDNALMWLNDYHVDGLRLDAVHALHDDSHPHLLAQLSTEVDALSSFLGKPLSLVAESDLNDPVMFTPRESEGYGLTGQWSDDFHHAVHVALTRETTGYYADFDSLGALAKVLTEGFFHNGTYSSFRERMHGKPIDTANVSTWRLVVANQNHDQIGNRATGDRLTATLTDGQLAIAAVLTLLGPFTPMLFMGEEWAASTPWQFFTSHPEPELGEATARGRIAEFAKMGWDEASVPDPQAPSTFENSKLDWAEATGEAAGASAGAAAGASAGASGGATAGASGGASAEVSGGATAGASGVSAGGASGVSAAGASAGASGDRHAKLLRLYREIAALRRSLPEFTDPRFTEIAVRYDDDARWFELRRGSISILINFADEPVDASTIDPSAVDTDAADVLLATQDVLTDTAPVDADAADVLLATQDVLADTAPRASGAAPGTLPPHSATILRRP